MGAQPKRKISKGRRNRRRAQDALSLPAMSRCPKCGKLKRPHFECAFCGHYGKLQNTSETKRKAADKTPQKKTSVK